MTSMTLIKHALGKSHYVESMLQVIGLTFQTMHHIRDSLRCHAFIGTEPKTFILCLHRRASGVVRPGECKKGKGIW
jgi:hypothetical protein